VARVRLDLVRRPLSMTSLPPAPLTLHLIPNAHLDPVWLWGWREGFQEMITTCSTLVDLMERRPELTFIRGESLVYAQIAAHAPALLERIQALIKAGRWDVVGGAVIQPDMNLCQGAVLEKHYAEGLGWLRGNLGVRPTVGWSADCFGHSAWLPSILRRAGLRAYAFGRPVHGPLAPDQPKDPVFWWESPDGRDRVLAHRTDLGWYGCERDEMPRKLDSALTAANGSPRRHHAVYFGLGNHGGGPVEAHLDQIAAWQAAHPDVRVVYSGLHRFFAALQRESKSVEFPVFRGELNYTLRGVYSTGARLKFPYRQAEAAVLRVDRTRAALARRLPKSTALPALPPELWSGLLFNTFHDILPATCVETAMEEQIDWIRGLSHTARRTEFELLAALGRRVDTTVPPAPRPNHPCAVPLLAWNPRPTTWNGPVELETLIDYRPSFHDAKPTLQVLDPAGRSVAFQEVATGHHFYPQLPWRKRVVIEASVPATGWALYTVGWVPGAKPARLPAPARRARSTDAHTIANSLLTVSARPGDAGVSCLLKGKPWFGTSGLQLLTMHDPWGSWGGHNGEAHAIGLNSVLHSWKVTDVRVEETGPLRASLWVRLAGGASSAELTFRLHAGDAPLSLDVRLFWAEEKARLKLRLPLSAPAFECEVPGGYVRRGEVGETPVLRWARVASASGRPGLAFATDALSDYDLHEGALQATIVRSTRYALSEPDDKPAPHYGPVVDRGEYRFRALLDPRPARAAELADTLDFAPVIQPVSPAPGSLPRTGSFA
jgi:alpha-mannosidase